MNVCYLPEVQLPPVKLRNAEPFRQQCNRRCAKSLMIVTDSGHNDLKQKYSCMYGYN